MSTSEIEKCGECRLVLPVGASHRDLRACVDALRSELTRAITCDACGEEIGELCVPCKAKKMALSKAGQWGTAWFMNQIQGMQGKKDTKRKDG